MFRDHFGFSIVQLEGLATVSGPQCQLKRGALDFPVAVSGEGFGSGTF